MVNEDLAPLVAPCCERHNAHLIEVVLRGKRSRPVVEVFVDAEDGVTSDLCSSISRDVGKVLDVLEQFPESYTLIVSSPGIERPLRFPWQYRKHIGRRMIVKVAGAEQEGTLRGVANEGITLELPQGSVEIAFSSIERAVVKAPW
jgi:ribosome maturation factor RimP